jgi:uncharacterized protein YdiU (UPF0061 family)
MKLTSLKDIEKFLDYSFLNSLNCDKDTKDDGIDYKNCDNKELLQRWSNWLEEWKQNININHNEVSKNMKKVNPKYVLREWFLVWAYKLANNGDYSLIKELQEVMTNPYDEQSLQIEEKYYKLKPKEMFNIAGISHVSCSS